jgi:phosphohistidine phosphatase SixA
MAAYVVRHAKAGNRDEWDGDDRLRPLTKSGQRQAEAIAESLEEFPIDQILSSPYVRCVQTVEPLAVKLKLPVEASRELQEGAGVAGAIRLMQQFEGKNVVLCTHGDIVEDLLQRLIGDGLLLRARANLEKGSTWVVDQKNGRFTGARYIPAP